MGNLHIIYMAAGNSRRFNGNKLLHKINGKAIYRYGLDMLLDFLKRHDDSTLTIVTQYETIVEEIRVLFSEWTSDVCINTVVSGEGDFADFYQFCDALNRRIQVVFNSDSYRGVSYTIRAGIGAIEKYEDFHWNSEKDSLMFVVADQPNLSVETVERLAFVRDFRSTELTAGVENIFFETAMVACGSRVGNPTLFHGKLAEELKKLSGDEGGRKVIHRHRCIRVEIENEEELMDIDTREHVQSDEGNIEEASGVPPESIFR